MNNNKSLDFDLKKYFLAFLAYRLICIFINQTWYVPDEYWQSQEVAHYMTFGYGYLTWEWKIGIRSYLYPLFIAFFYKLLALLYLDKTVLLVYIVPIIHAFISALGDLVFYIYASKFFESKIAYKALICRLLSYYTIYSSTRSLTNNIEEFFTICILASLQQALSQSNNAQFYKFHVLSFVSFVIRSTSAINLIPIYVYQFFFLITDNKTRVKFFFQFILVGVIVFGITIGIDSYFHGELLVSFYNFLLYNVYHNVGTHYGTHSWHWYLTQGYPTLMFTLLVLFFIGLQYYEKTEFIVNAIIFNILAYSLLAHKEFRFLTQIMPFSMIVCAYGFSHAQRNFKQHIYIFLLGVVFLGNVFLATVLGLIHQQAPIALMHHLRQDNVISYKDSILFLTPCHSTPFYSFLHKNVPMQFLTCEPNFDKSITNYLDEADKFWINPSRWFDQNEKILRETTHVVLFENLYQRLTRSTKTSHYLSNFSICKRFYHSFTKTTERTDKYLLLMCKNKPQQQNNDDNNSYKIDKEL